MIPILIADDHPVVRSGLESILSSQPDFTVVDEAEDGAEAVRLALRLEPDLILMDLRMPGTDGVTAIEKLSAAGSTANVLVLTTYDSDADILRAVEAGATGYLLKDARREDLYAAVRSAACGRSALAPTVADSLMRSLRRPKQQELSRREVEVLELVRRGQSNKQVARTLHVSEATVKTHLIHAFDKLSVNDRTAAVSVALERGILLLE